MKPHFQISSDITRKCTELLIQARNALAISMTPTEKSLNSSNNTQTIDSEQNITPIEEHLDVNFANNSNAHSTPTETTINTAARDLTKRFESFSKGIMETLKFDKRSTNPFEYEIEIGATEIHPKDLLKERESIESEQMSKMNGNNGDDRNYARDGSSTLTRSDDDSCESFESKLLNIFEHRTASMFHTLLPLIFGHIAALASSDPRSSVQVLSLIRDILPHVAALNKCGGSYRNNVRPVMVERDIEHQIDDIFAKCANDDFDETDSGRVAIPANQATSSKGVSNELVTTSNHYCIVESEHPYKPSSINYYK